MILDILHAEHSIAAALRCEVQEQTFTDADGAAREFGLRPLGDGWRRIDQVMAARVLFALLISDMAYSSPRLSEEQAKAACDEFLSQFSANSLFFTNGNWEEKGMDCEDHAALVGLSWTPATNATFDAGVIVLDHTRSGVLWLEDEV